MIRHFLFVAAFTVSTPAFCDGLVFHLQSHHKNGNHDVTETWVDKDNASHTGTKRGLNNNNFGIGYKSDDGYSIGVYKNSFFNTSTYAGKEFMYNRYFGGFVGVATGYKEQSGKSLMPFLAGTVKIPIDNTYALVFNVIPTKEFNDYVVINMAIERKF
jgi:hypothetical protein